MKNSILTVVTPVTNMAGKLSKLESWVDEALELGVKVVVVHDYREAKTQEELQKIVNRHHSERLILLSGKFGNPGAARNAGMTNLISEWICFWDSDDLPNVSNVIAEINSSQPLIDVIIGQFVTVDNNLEAKPNKTSTTYCLDDFALNPGLWRILIRSKLVNQLEFPPLRMGEDQVFLNNLNLGSLHIKFSREIFYKYFSGDPNQLTNNEKALSDLYHSIQQVRVSIPSKSGADLHLALIMLTRLCLTSLKNGNLGLKSKSVFPLFLTFAMMGPKLSVKVISRVFRG